MGTQILQPDAISGSMGLQHIVWVLGYVHIYTSGDLPWQAIWAQTCPMLHFLASNSHDMAIIPDGLAPAVGISHIPTLHELGVVHFPNAPNSMALKPSHISRWYTWA